MTLEYAKDMTGYVRARAGHYPAFNRRFRREIETILWAAGYAPPLWGVSTAAKVVAEYGGMAHGAPGLLGGCPDEEALSERRRAAYGPGSLPG